VGVNKRARRTGGTSATLLPDGIVAAVSAVPAVTGVKIVGSRAEGRASVWSDWEFQVSTDDFPAVRDSLPQRMLALRPVILQWDRLSKIWCFMLVLAGPTKVDLIFTQPHRPERPWLAGPTTLAGIDDHFWDWVLWLHSKQATGQAERVAVELRLLHAHLLSPLGVASAPTSVSEAVRCYRAARADWEARLGLSVSRQPEQVVLPALELDAGNAP
jgi:hypothetical protein